MVSLISSIMVNTTNFINESESMLTASQFGRPFFIHCNSFVVSGTTPACDDSRQNKPTRNSSLWLAGPDASEDLYSNIISA